ncbi:MAG: hypothetical protein Q7T71_08805 [Herbiconiux sp.]|nr:hypothetical protein [Herbiconiux sp.]
MSAVPARTARLVLALRVAYILAGALFVADILIAVVGSYQMLSRFGIILLEGPLGTLTEWIALSAFVFAALGAVLTVVATIDYTGAGIDSDTTFDHATLDH